MVQLFAKMSNVILVAPSMSSKYALPFAVTEPERLAGLVLVGPVGTGLVPRRKLELLQVTHFFLKLHELMKSFFDDRCLRC